MTAWSAKATTTRLSDGFGDDMLRGGSRTDVMDGGVGDDRYVFRFAAKLPGAEIDWHLHPVPSFGMVLQGTLEVTLEDGRVRRIQAGEALAEVINTIHNGRNVGDTPVKLVVFYAGAVRQPNTIRQP